MTLKARKQATSSLEISWNFLWRIQCTLAMNHTTLRTITHSNFSLGYTKLIKRSYSLVNLMISEPPLAGTFLAVKAPLAVPMS